MYNVIYLYIYEYILLLQHVTFITCYIFFSIISLHSFRKQILNVLRAYEAFDP